MATLYGRHPMCFNSSLLATHAELAQLLTPPKRIRGWQPPPPSSLRKIHEALARDWLAPFGTITKRLLYQGEQGGDCKALLLQHVYATPSHQNL